MIRNVLLALALVAAPALAGCTGSTTPQQTEVASPANQPSTVAAEKTVTINGAQLTCKDIVDTSSEHCIPLMQRVFDDYSWRLNAFINDGNLNELKAQEGITSKEIAYVGLVACATMTGIPTYEDYFRAFEHDVRFDKLTSPKPALADAWSEAEKLLCFPENES